MAQRTSNGRTEPAPVEIHSARQLLPDLPPARVDEQTTAEAALSAAHALTDVKYALRQLRQYRDVGRAIDALERVESELESIR